MPKDNPLYSYFGLNLAHQKFKRQIINEKIFYYMVAGGKEELIKYFEERVDEAKRQTDKMRFALGLITKAISNTQFRAIMIPASEVELVLHDYNDFFLQVWRKVYVECQRIFETFLIELYGEIARKEPRVLHSEKQVSSSRILEAYNNGDVIGELIAVQQKSLSEGGLLSIEAAFADMKLPLIPSNRESSQELDTRLKLLWAARNIIVHNDGLVDKKFIKICSGSGLKVGDTMNITSEEICDAFALTQFLADDINNRAVAKYHIDET